MVLGMNLYNLGQFIYHFLSGRLLGKVQYGELATAITILGFFAIVQMALGLTIVKFISECKQEKDKSNFIKWILYFSFWVGLLISLGFMLLAPFLADFLNFSQISTLILLGPILFFYLLATVARSALQGLLKFDKYIFSFLTESVSKIILSILLISLGFALFGVMLALLLGIVLSLIIAFFYLRVYLNGKMGEKPNFSSLFKYSSATLLQGLALTSMYSIDLILVKHFFSSSDAGIYASLAILGRVVFFGASPISNVMFPIVAKRKFENKNYLEIFYTSLGLIITFSVVLVAFYFFFPQIAITVLFGKEFLDGAPFLWLYGLFMSLLAIAMFLTQFYLSIGKTKMVVLFLITAFLQMILITVYHPDILGVIKMSVLSAALLDVILFVYFLMIKNEKTSISDRSGLQTRKNNTKRSKKH